VLCGKYIEKIWPKLKLVLLVLQIFLPFGIYFAFVRDSQFLSIIISVFYCAGMLILIMVK
jgi:hypothetical protein